MKLYAVEEAVGRISDGESVSNVVHSLLDISSFEESRVSDFLKAVSEFAKMFGDAIKKALRELPSILRSLHDERDVLNYLDDTIRQAQDSAEDLKAKFEKSGVQTESIIQEGVAEWLKDSAEKLLHGIIQGASAVGGFLLRALQWIVGSIGKPMWYWIQNHPLGLAIVGTAVAVVITNLAWMIGTPTALTGWFGYLVLLTYWMMRGLGKMLVVAREAGIEKVFDPESYRDLDDESIVRDIWNVLSNRSPAV